MARNGVFVKVPKSLERELKTTFEKFSRDKRLQESIGKFLVERIQLFMRRGVEIISKRRYDKVGKSWAKRRERLAEYNTTSEGYDIIQSSRRSNLNFTGQLHDSISFRLRDGKTEIFIKPGTRTPYQGVTKKVLYSDIKTNIGLARKYKEGSGREFFAIDDKGIDGVRSITLRFLRRLLRRRE